MPFSLQRVYSQILYMYLLSLMQVYLIKDGVFCFLGLRGFFPFLFEQNPISNDFRPDIIEGSKIMADVLQNGDLYYITHVMNGFRAGAAIFGHGQT